MAKKEKNTHQKKKLDTEELIKMLNKLPEEEKLIIFGMVKGVELANQKEPVA